MYSVSAQGYSRASPPPYRAAARTSTTSHTTPSDCAATHVATSLVLVYRPGQGGRPFFSIREEQSLAEVRAESSMASWCVLAQLEDVAHLEDLAQLTLRHVPNETKHTNTSDSLVRLAQRLPATKVDIASAAENSHQQLHRLHEVQH